MLYLVTKQFDDHEKMSKELLRKYHAVSFHRFKMYQIHVFGYFRKYGHYDVFDFKQNKLITIASFSLTLEKLVNSQK